MPLTEVRTMAYSNYNVEDFVTDEYFIKWVKSPDEETNAFWNSWLAQHTHKRSEVNRAREIILMLDIKENPAPEGKFLETWEKILMRTDEKPDRPVVLLKASLENKADGEKKQRWFYKLAAAVALIAVVFGGYRVYDNVNTVLIHTAYGESQTLFLPDSTKVTLNANSTLRYKKQNFSSHEREVWLDGEAFFAVVRKANNENFKVQTKELEVEVLGTRFDVSSRRGKTKVVLEEGKVRLDMNRSDLQQHLVMKPGEFVEVTKHSKNVEHKAVNPEDFLSWRNNVLEFSGTSLADIAQMIEDNYGYKVVFSDKELSQHKFTGSSSSDDLQELTQKLSKVFNLKITQDGNIITIEAH